VRYRCIAVAARGLVRKLSTAGWAHGSSASQPARGPCFGRGSIPLLKDPFFGAMAVCIMFGLSFAAVLSLILTPVLYAIFFNVQEGTPLTERYIAKTSPA